jgi:hypothetical protein
MNTNKNPNLVIEYAKTTQNMCLCLGIVGLLIIILIIMPLNTYNSSLGNLSIILGKGIVLILLVYMIYYNIQQTNIFSNNFNISFLEASWNPVKTNILCSYVFTVGLLFLAFSVLRV